MGSKIIQTVGILETENLGSKQELKTQASPAEYKRWKRELGIEDKMKEILGSKKM